MTKDEALARAEEAELHLSPSDITEPEPGRAEVGGMPAEQWLERMLEAEEALPPHHGERDTSI